MGNISSNNGQPEVPQSKPTQTCHQTGGNKNKNKTNKHIEDATNENSIDESTWNGSYDTLYSGEAPNIHINQKGGGDNDNDSTNTDFPILSLEPNTILPEHPLLTTPDSILNYWSKLIKSCFENPDNKNQYKWAQKYIFDILLKLYGEKFQSQIETIIRNPESDKITIGISNDEIYGLNIKSSDDLWNQSTDKRKDEFIKYCSNFGKLILTHFKDTTDIKPTCDLQKISIKTEIKPEFKKAIETIQLTCTLLESVKENDLKLLKSTELNEEYRKILSSIHDIIYITDAQIHELIVKKNSNFKDKRWVTLSDDNLIDKIQYLRELCESLSSYLTRANGVIQFAEKYDLIDLYKTVKRQVNTSQATLTTDANGNQIITPSQELEAIFNANPETRKVFIDINQSDPTHLRIVRLNQTQGTIYDEMLQESHPEIEPNFNREDFLEMLINCVNITRNLIINGDLLTVRYFWARMCEKITDSTSSIIRDAPKKTGIFHISQNFYARAMLARCNDQYKFATYRDYLNQTSIDLHTCTTLQKLPKIGFGADLMKLESINFDNCNISLLESIGDLHALRILKLNNNQLTHIPNNIGMLPSLEILELKNNKLVSIDLDIDFYPKLKNIDISGNESTMDPSVEKRWIDTQKLKREEIIIKPSFASQKSAITEETNIIETPNSIIQKNITLVETIKEIPKESNNEIKQTGGANRKSSKPRLKHQLKH